MIESLAEHGVQASDLVPSLMTTHTVANPEYDPAEGKRKELAEKEDEERRMREEESCAEDITEDSTDPTQLSVPKTPVTPSAPYQTTANVLPPSTSETMPGVSTSLSAADKDVTLDIRWTVLCDLFLLLIADSVYDARSRVLLEMVAYKMGLGWLDIVKFEERVTEALEIQEGIEKLEQKDIIEGRVKAAKRRRYAMLGLATLGLYSQDQWRPRILILYARRRTGYWAFRRSSCTCHRRRSCWCLHYNRCDRYIRISSRDGRNCRYCDCWYPDRFGHCCSRHGAKNAGCTNF